MTSIFEKYKYSFSDIHKELLESFSSELNADMLRLYSNYTALDNNYPRPLLTLLGMNYMNDLAPELDNCPDKHFLMIPQLLRDVLAIHDDIIDEDLSKFQQDTLPYAFSKIFSDNSSVMTKEGKDFALLFGDYLYPKIYRIVSNARISSDKKVEIITHINDVMEVTNIGQINELVMQHTPLQNYTSNDILQMYQNKAADYCYAFPFTLGATYAGAPNNIIKKAREILLRLGAASQIIDDLMGVFPEALGETKSTLSDLLCLRRSYLLKLLSEHNHDDSDLKSILVQPACSSEQALLLKKKIVETETIDKIVKVVLSDCKAIEYEISTLDIGSYCKKYFNKLVNSRIRANLERIVSFFESYGG